ncbi:MAG: ATP-dependent RecD-like DNA helicase [Deltaproteobacteria bacterium]|nr:ATP-dependent RecD-like DNA helicase [Deltaproteobacteria bacterium]
MPSVEGTVRVIRFQNPDSFWTIATLESSGRGESDVKVVGALPGLAEGMVVRLEGRWEESPKYGRQFKAERFTEIVPATPEGLQAYLASGFIPGIGDKLAERIVEAFGTDTIDVIMNHPERLAAEVKKLGKKKAQALIDAFAERRGAQDALVFLMGLGVGRGSAMRILKRYGDDTVRVVRNNPYKLAQDVHGIGFVKADQVARGMDIAADHPERVKAGLLHVMREARGEGHVRVPRGLLLERGEALLGVASDVLENGLAALVALSRVIVEAAPNRPDDVVYLRSLHEAEVGVAWHLARLMDQVDDDEVDPHERRARVTEAAADLGIALAPAQSAAVLLALDEPLVILTGGPGTGKTTIIRTLLHATTLPDDKIALAAPTGRAAKRMAEATGRPALTLHRLLEFNPVEGTFNRSEQDPLPSALVIVDEASMVDLPLMYALVRALPDGARLVLVGDRDQLPPVGPGSPLTDLIACERVPVARLTHIFRQGAGSAIIEAAHRLNAGQVVPPTAPMKGESAISDFHFVAREEPDQIRSMIELLVTERIPERFGLDARRDVQVLSPMRAGPIGVDALNERLQALLNPLPPDTGALVLGEDRKMPFRAGDKVMQIRNDYDKGVFNGDIGFVRSSDRGVLHVEMEDKLVTYDRESWDDLVLAYAVTVHKSQGSEYPAIVMPVSTHHFKMLRRNLLYTGVTRGKRLVVLVGTERAMRIAVSNATVESRDSGLGDRLGDAIRERRAGPPRAWEAQGPSTPFDDNE